MYWKLRWGIQLDSGQQFLRWLTEHCAAFVAIKPHDQSEGASWTADRAPGHPNTVGMSETGFAMVRRELIGCHDVLFQRTHAVEIVVFAIKQIDRHTPLDLHWIRLAVLIKIEPSTKSTDGGFSRLVQDGICPNRQNAVGQVCSRLSIKPQHAVFASQRRASTYPRAQSNDHEQAVEDWLDGGHGIRCLASTRILLAIVHRFIRWGFYSLTAGIKVGVDDL